MDWPRCARGGLGKVNTRETPFTSAVVRAHICALLGRGHREAACCSFACIRMASSRTQSKMLLVQTGVRALLPCDNDVGDGRHTGDNEHFERLCDLGGGYHRTEMRSASTMFEVAANSVAERCRRG